MLWSTLKAQVRRILKDTVPASYRWQDADLQDYVAWSLDALCSHTAIATATSFTLDSSTGIFVLPDNIYEPLERSGAVYSELNGTKTYLNPVHYNRISQASGGYYVNGAGLNLVNTTNLSGDLIVQYFAMYPHPSNDSDELYTPTWATAALVYRIAAYAMTLFAGRRANIAQWNQKKDSGRPTDNPLEEQAESFFDMWERELALYPVQQRENYFTV